MRLARFCLCPMRPPSPFEFETLVLKAQTLQEWSPYLIPFTCHCQINLGPFKLPSNNIANTYNLKKLVRFFE